MPRASLQIRVPFRHQTQSRERDELASTLQPER